MEGDSGRGRGMKGISDKACWLSSRAVDLGCCVRRKGIVAVGFLPLAIIAYMEARGYPKEEVHDATLARRKAALLYRI